MFQLALLTKAAARPLTARALLPSLTRPVSLPRATASFATPATKTASKASEGIDVAAAPKAKKATSATKATRSTTTKLTNKKAAAANKPKGKPGPKPKKAKNEPKLKPWQARGPDGKLLPLPSATRPTLRASFLIYMAERLPTFKGVSEFQKPSVKGDGQVLDIVKASKKVGEEWKALSASEKKKYEDIHEKEKAEYVKALAHWKATLTAEDIRRQNAYISAQRKKGIKGVALLRDPAKPKRPNSAFFEYLAELRSQDNTGAYPTDIARKGGETWKTMSANAKAPYEQKAAGAMEQYRKDLEDYTRAKEAQL